jgi:hypothetical protein
MLGAVGCGPTRQSQNTQPSELNFRALLTDGEEQALFHRDASDR